MTQAPIQSSPTSGSAQWQAKAQLFDYRQAANPVRAGLTEPIPLRQWEPALHQSGPTAILPLDLSSELGCSAPATSPGLAAHFLRIKAGEGLKAAANATSLLFYVLHGSGSIKRADTPQLDWSAGDLFVLPAGVPPC
jgi:Gentisate 1,2-dioxygenase